MSSLDHHLRNVMQVLQAAVTMLPRENEAAGKLVWLDLLTDAADRCDRAMEQLEAAEHAGGESA